MHASSIVNRTKCLLVLANELCAQKVLTNCEEALNRVGTILSSKELTIAIEAAETAGKILMKYFGRAKAAVKPDRSLVTETDIESEKIIKAILEAEFPDHSFLGEESGRHETKSKALWVVDPLDGTTNYVMMNPFFDVSIALVQRNEPVLGVVHYPFLNETFYAERGKGAFSGEERIHVSMENTLENSIIAFCHGRDKKSVVRTSKIFSSLKPINNKVRQLGAAGLELCYVACGRIECFLMPGINPWDVMAGAIISEEANGRVSDFEGDAFSAISRDILVSNNMIHNQLLEILGRI